MPAKLIAHRKRGLEVDKVALAPCAGGGDVHRLGGEYHGEIHIRMRTDGEANAITGNDNSNRIIILFITDPLSIDN